MLIVNLSDELVNGLTGKITDLHDSTVDVVFPSIDKQCTLSAFSFAVYDKDKHMDIACRKQIPLRLSFALLQINVSGWTNLYCIK